MKISFAPFDRECVAALSAATATDFSGADFTAERWLCVSGRDADGVLVGLCCFEFKRGFDAYFTAAIRHPSCLSRRLLTAMFTAVFSRAVRISAEIEPGNARALDEARRLGFSIEGFKPLAIEGRRDAVLLGMTADACRWLRAAPRPPQRAGNEVPHGLHA